ncbi:MAG TPA: 5-oxoprolinase subunit PxpA [Vicinamibacterales bacterium]|nr:5-oxoprolinase subunit PxpA [Vicinamibacterales bacterium]
MRRLNIEIIDLNADVGEGCGYDAALMPFITSANVAAGLHAGSPEILRETVRLAAHHGVNVGAHPGFHDRENFGRRELALAPSAIESLVLEQLQVVADAAVAEGVRMVHVKPHGALYNMAAKDRVVADATARAIVAFDPSLTLFAPPYSQLFAAGGVAGLRVLGEAFADRAYHRDGSLVPRHVRGAVIDDKAVAVARAVRMASESVVVTADGSELHMEAGTICVHGDTPGCVAMAHAIRSALDDLSRGSRSAM